jgi:transcription termination factor Rho
MSVLKRKELEDSPLADLHAIASELGLEGFRAKRKDDLIASILDATGAAPEDEAVEQVEEDREPDEVPAEEALEAPAAAGTAVAVGAEEAEREEEPEPEEEEEEETSEDTSEDTSEGTSEGTSEEEDEAAEEGGPPEREEELVSGVLDILANGSGFVRVDPAGLSRDDVYVSPAQIRRCELRAGDEVSGPVRPPRRNERHPSLVRVAEVNGREAEPPEERPWFGDLTAVFPSARVGALAALESVPFGRGSRVAVAGPPGAGATRLLRELADSLAKEDDVDVQVVLAGVRPEEVTEWRSAGDLNVVGGSFDRSPDAQTQAAELAVERAKRRVERGGHAAVIVDSLDALPGGAQRRLFGAARATEEGGTLTVIAATGDSAEALRWATTRIVLEPGGKLGAQSGTLREEALK